MPEENINQEFRLKKNRWNKKLKINQNELMSKKDKMICRVLNYIKESLIAIAAITAIFIYIFVSLVGILIGITSSAIVLKIWAITAGIKKYKSIIKKKRKRHDKILLLAKYKLNSIEVLISKGLIDSNISHDERNQKF